MTYKATADFSDILKQANAVGKQSGKLFSDNFNLAQGGMFAKSLARFKDIQKKIEKDGKDAATRLEIHKLGLAKKTHAEELKLEREAKVLKAKAAAETDKDTKKALGQQYAAKLKELKLVQSYNKDTGKFIAKMNKSMASVQSIASITNREIKQLERATKTLKSVSEWVDENLRSGSEKFGENLTEAAEGLGDVFTAGIDVTALSKKLSVGLGKGLSKAGDLMGAAGGGGGAAGTALKVLGGAVGVIGATVGALGALVAAFIMFDKKVKEFNKDIIKTHGALSVMRLGAGNLNQGLTTLKRTVMDLSGNFGVSEDEAKQLFASLDNGNLTLRRLSAATFQGQSAQAALSTSLRDTYTAANLTGVGLSEYADNLTNYVNDLGMSTQTVNDNFRSIAKMASESAFSTRRFYSMVVQATSGQSALNVSMDQTGDLLLRMSKIMGMKKAAEMVGGATSDMGGMSATDRIKTLLIAGGRGTRAFSRDAQAQAGGFSTAHGGAADQTALRSAAVAGLGANLGKTIADAIKNGGNDPASLVHALGGLQTKQQQQLVSSLRNTGATPEERATNAETARQLDQLIQVTRGAQGSRSDRVAAMGGLSAGGSLAMRAAQMRRFMNPDGHVSEINRAAAENVSGMSGHQMDSFLSLMQANAGDMAQLRALSQKAANASRPGHEAMTPAETQILAQLQETHHVTAQNGVVMTRGANSHAITDTDELLQTNPERTALAIEKTRTEAESIALQTMDATVSIADIMENKIAQILQHVYDVLNGPINAALTFVVDHFPGLGDGGAAAKALKVQHDALQQIDEKIAGTASIRSKRVRDIASARVTANSSDASETDRSAARERLARLQADQQRENQALEHMQSIRSSVASGNTYYTREGAGHDDFMNTTQNMTQIPPGWHRGPNGTVVRDTGAPAPTAPGATPGATPAAAPGVTPGTAAPTVAPTPPPPTPAHAEAATAPVVAPGVTPGTAAPTVAPTPPPPTPAHAEAATAPVVAATEDVQTQAQEQHQQLRRDARQRDRQAQVFNEKLLKGRELGDGLAMSKLPDAIAEADAKVRLTEALFKGGKTSDEVARILAGRNLTEADTGNADYGGMIRSRQSRVDAGVHDFISQDRGGRTVITPINRADQVMGMKPGGPVANAASRGGGGNVNISINGGDERRVFDVVRRAIQQAGITPNRVPGG